MTIEQKIFIWALCILSILSCIELIHDLIVNPYIALLLSILTVFSYFITTYEITFDKKLKKISKEITFFRNDKGCYDCHGCCNACNYLNNIDDIVRDIKC